MLDDNSTKGGDFYVTSKEYFWGIERAGGIPFAIPYVRDFVDFAASEFDGYLSVGGDVAFPDDWYLPGHPSPDPYSERVHFDIPIMQSFLDANKPVLGVCHGMQQLAGASGCKFRSDLHETHCGWEIAHDVSIHDNTTLAKIIGAPRLSVNSRHKMAVVELGPHIRVNAMAPCGTIEGIERTDKKFALGVQWHQEDFINQDHPGNAIFKAFVDSCRASS